MSGSQLLVWGMTLFLSGSLGNAVPRTDALWYPNQRTPMIGGLRPSIIHLSSNVSTMDSVSIDDTTPPGSISEKNKIPSGKFPQHPPASQEQKPAILVPEIPNKDNGQVIVTYRAKIDETQNLLRTINEGQLSKEQHDTYVSINSFLEKAQEAFSQNDMSMALNLSEKANTLAKEIVNNSTKP